MSTFARSAFSAGVLLSAVSAGANVGISALQVPRLLELPTDLMLRHWSITYNKGKVVFPSLSAATALSFIAGYVASRRAAASPLSVSRLPLLAAVLTLSIIPYTLLLMMKTNRALLARAAKVDADAASSSSATPKTADSNATPLFTAQEVASTKYLVDYWSTLNLGRSTLLLSAAVVGLVSLA